MPAIIASPVVLYISVLFVQLIMFDEYADATIPPIVVAVVFVLLYATVRFCIVAFFTCPKIPAWLFVLVAKLAPVKVMLSPSNMPINGYVAVPIGSVNEATKAPSAFRLLEVSLK